MPAKVTTIQKTATVRRWARTQRARVVIMAVLLRSIGLIVSFVAQTICPRNVCAIKSHRVCPRRSASRTPRRADPQHRLPAQPARHVGPAAVRRADGRAGADPARSGACSTCSTPRTASPSSSSGARSGWTRARWWPRSTSSRPRAWCSAARTLGPARPRAAPHRGRTRDARSGAARWPAAPSDELLRPRSSDEQRAAARHAAADGPRRARAQRRRRPPLWTGPPAATVGRAGASGGHPARAAACRQVARRRARPRSRAAPR